MNAILIAVAVKSVALLAAAVLLGWMIRKASAAAQHLVWTAAFAGLLVLPFLNASLPSLPIAATDRILAPVATFTTTATAASETAPSARTVSQQPAKSPRIRWTILAWIWALIWSTGAVLGCARLLVACVGIVRLRARSRLIETSELARLAREAGVRTRVHLYESPGGSMPMTAGLLRPAIFLPAFASEWSFEKRRSVLLHELAHIRRGDVATQILARLAVHLYWWNPLAWFAWREFLKVRERAADDLVLAAGSSASEYASHLLEIARSASPVPALAAIAMAQPSQLESRLAAILDSRIPRKAPGRFAVGLTAIAAAALIAPLAAIHAQETPVPSDVEATIRIATGQNNFEMLDRAAEAFIKNRQYDPARKLLEASLEVRAKVAGTHSDTYADGLLKLGDLSWQHPRKGDNFYEQAIALGDRPENARALLRAGILKFRDLPTAENYIQRAIPNAKGEVYAESLAWMAEIRNAQGGAAEAEALFLRAQSAASKDSAAAALIGEMYASFLTAHNRKEETPALMAGASSFRAQHVASLSPHATISDAKSLKDGGITPPKVLNKVEPEYSTEARVLKISGTVTLSLIVNTDGTAQNVTLQRGVGFGLDEKALAGVSQFKFSPATENGAAVPVHATIEVNFRLL